MEGGAAHPPSYASLLRHWPFLAIWLGGTVSIVGNAMFLLALQWWIVQTTGSIVDLTLLALADALPMLIFGPFAGFLTDRWERRRLLMIVNLIEGALVFVVVILAITNQLVPWHAYATMFILGVLSTPAYPALSAAMPDIVPRNHLPQANAFMQASMSMGGLVGYGIGGFITSAFGLAAVFELNALSFLIAAGALALARFHSQGQPSPHGLSLHEFLEGIQVVWCDPVARVLTGVALVYGLLYAPIPALLPALIAQNLHQAAEGFGLVRAALSLGLLIGAIATGFWARGGRFGARTLLTVALTGIALVAFSASPYLWMAATALFLAGFFDGTAEVLSMSILQPRFAGAVRGRAFAVIATLAMATRVLGLGIGGPIAVVLTAPSYFVLAGGGIALVALMGMMTEVRAA